MLHDRIVGKEGAFHLLCRGLSILGQAGARLELRTAVMSGNVQALPDLARYIACNVPFCETWALMQLERIGFARKNWTKIFADTSEDFRSVARAINIAAAKGVPVSLYNFPLCTVPTPYRGYARNSISDWKRKFLSVCDHCTEIGSCCGFFEWYDTSKGFAYVTPL